MKKLFLTLTLFFLYALSSCKKSDEVDRVKEDLKDTKERVIDRTNEAKNQIKKDAERKKEDLEKAKDRALDKANEVKDQVKKDYSRAKEDVDKKLQ